VATDSSGNDQLFKVEEFDPAPYPFTRRAPELWSRGSFGRPADVWAVGSIAVEMMTLQKVLLGDHKQEQISLIAGVQPRLTQLEAQCVLSHPQTVILRGLLCADPSQRMTAGAALCESYFDGCSLKNRAAENGRPVRKVLKAKRTKGLANTAKPILTVFLL